MNVIAGWRLIDFVILTLVSINNVDLEINHFRIYPSKSFFLLGRDYYTKENINSKMIVIFDRLQPRGFSCP